MKAYSFITDLIGIAGGGGVAYGCYLLRPAAGFIAGGVLLIALAAVMAYGRGGAQ